jgi:hypothetical protein
MKLLFLPLLVLGLMLTLVTVACGGESDAQTQARVTIEPLTSTPAAAATIPLGGKPATPPVAPTSTPEPAVEAPTDIPPADTPATEATSAVDLATATTVPRASDGSVAPTSGAWIDVDVTTYVVRLMEGSTVVREIAPVGVGVQVDTGEYASTQTGLFYVNSKIEPLAYDAPYDTYISHWVGFDAAKANGFHSLLKDAAGTVVDASTGRVSNGCIRTGEPEAVYAYAQIGMPVWVHW